MKMLSNVDYYQEIPTNDDKKTMQKIKNLLKRHKTTSCLTEKEEDYLTDYEYKESNFYGLPKIHKSTTIKDAIKVQCSEYIRCPHPDDITFRPIVGGPSAPTQRLSNLLDILLKPLCTDVKSYVKDDLDFLRHLPEKIIRIASSLLLMSLICTATFQILWDLTRWNIGSIGYLKKSTIGF